MELFIQPVDPTGNYLIYRPLVSLAFVGNQAMADLCYKIAQLGSDSFPGRESPAEKFLESIHFFDPDPPPPPEYARSFQPTLAVLLMTNRCQLRCTYCYADAGEVPAADLDPETALAAINFVYQNARNTQADYFEVSFHGGGEPSLAWELLQACTHYARQKTIPARITLTSNGIWSDEHCQWIVENLDGISLSMDGRIETQNTQRPFSSGAGSFQTVWRNIQNLDQHGFDYAIRLTAAEPWQAFPKEIEFLCKETHCKSLHVEPTFHIQRGTHGDPQPGDGDGFVNAFLEGADIAESFERPLLYSGARLGLVQHTFCSAPFNALIVNPLNQLVTCYELAGREHPMNAISVIGSLTQTGMVLMDSQRENLHQLLAARRRACKDCFCYWSCAGDCYVRALTDPGADVRVRGERCQINRMITQGLILKHIARGNGIWYAPRQAAHAAVITQKEQHAKSA